MNRAARAVLAFVTFLAALYFTFWVGGAVLLGLGFNGAGPTIWAISLVVALIVAVGAARFIWIRSAAAGGFISAVVLGGVVTGAIGFSVGFFGPLIFMPHANQGPMLGIFITGPLGFLIGLVGGGIVWTTRRRRAGV